MQFSDANRRKAKAVSWLLGVQLLVLAIVAIWTAYAYPILQSLDEVGHYSYVVTIADQLRLPVLGQDRADPSALAVVARSEGLITESYEAFQPPLYYLVAAPIARLGASVESRVYALRALGVVLLFVTVALLAALARILCPNSWQPLLAAGLVALLFPGVVVRDVSVSNDALTLPVSLLFLIVAWRAIERRTKAQLALAGAVLGLCALTKLTLVFVAVPVLLHAWRARLTLRSLFLPTAMALFVLLPWLSFNLAHYGSLTATSAALEIQRPFVPESVRDPATLGVTEMLTRLLDPVVPEEWGPFVAARPGLRYLRWLVTITVLFAPLIVLAPRFAFLRRAEVSFVGTILPAGIVLFIAATYLTSWNVALPRYIYPAYLAWELAVAMLIEEERPRSSHIFSGTCSLLLLLLWGGLFAALAGGG